MNKRFSTLLAGTMLAVGSFSANADVAVPSLSLTADNGLVQIAVGAAATPSAYLAIENDSLKLVPEANVKGDLFLNTLWCVKVESYDQGQAVKYKFTNKATSQELKVSADYLKGVVTKTADLTVTDEANGITGWAFSNTLKPLVGELPMYYYFNEDSVVAFVEGTAIGTTGNKTVQLEKYLGKSTNDYPSLEFSLVYANEMTLTAKQINTILGVQADEKFGVKLKFTPDKNKVQQVNYFTDEFFLSEAVANEDFVRVINKKDSAYLVVDTSYINTNGEKFLAFDTIRGKKADLNGGTLAAKLGALDEQAKFLFRYWPSKDSLVIQVKQSTVSDANGSFANGTETNIGADGKIIATQPNAGEYSNYVTVQDLVKADQIRIVTIYNKKETEIKLGIGTCGAQLPTNKTTIGEGLYLIKNKAGKYLAMPIHEDSTYHWVTVEANVNPWDMPSFQWVIEQTKKNNATSPISITNREFGAAKGTAATSMQLFNDADATIAGSAVALVVKTVGEANVETAGFQKANTAIMSNQYLGYRYLDKDSLLVTTYKLKYWTSFAKDDLYMGAMKSGDSVIYVGAKDNYVLTSTGAAANFGYKGNVAGLSQLLRQAYTMKSKGTDKMVVEAAENRIAVSDAANAQLAKFFFKANNNVEGAVYYALVDTAYKTTPDSLRKVGVDENNKYLKRQVMTETRTSAFTVEIDDAPIYRRFNTALEGVASDAVDTLRFYEKYRNEYLQLEANKNFMVEGKEFLGIDAADKATDGLSFIVDTAWVKRGLGYIKPQYLVSLANEPASTITVVKRCAICQALIDAGKEAPEHCIHDEIITYPGHVRGHYLVNFVDSIAANSANTAVAKDYNWGKYTRVGFVDGIHVGDSLYLLINQFAGIATKNIDLAAIVAANKKYLDNGGVKDRNGNGYYIKNLREDDHKAYTWSFRYVNTDAAIEVIEEPNRSFLFESLPLVQSQKIQPTRASWLKMQNGCLVMSDPNASTFNEVITGGDDALIFNVKQGSKEDLATDAVAPEVSTISVIAVEGGVKVMNAAGKKVTINNVLGQVVAETVINSDDATINAPKGFVTVAVEGEAAVKAIVK